MPNRHVWDLVRPATSSSPCQPSDGNARGRFGVLGGFLVVCAGVALAASGALTASPGQSAPGKVVAAGRLKVAQRARVHQPAVVAALSERALRSRDEVSRSGVRPPAFVAERTTKAQALPTSGQQLGSGVTRTVAPPDPRSIARSMLARYGWSSDQFSCLDALWTSESNWNPYAENSSSGAYGIPQALPGDKMAAAGPDWRVSPATQIRWGLQYIRSSYGSPCAAWYFKSANSWY